ncbi:ChaN family lipoprotein [Megamonas hypermegale]|uniref:ChaN family lipoprotein n=1 Tax=Megamonas hypermegale TaxID=158847 RepID=UPI00320B9EC6
MKKLMRMFVCGGLLLTGCLGVVGFAQEKPAEVKYYYDDKEISPAQAVKIAGDYDVVFFDEYHDQSSIHQAEFDFFKALYTQNPDMILSMEMFERDVQSVMNEYLQDKITEEEFLAYSRPWDNYLPDYKPLVEFAKENSIFVLASNIPRRMAAQYAKTGDFSLISETDKKYLPQKHLVEYGAYYNKFKNYMVQGQDSRPMMMTPERIELFYKAQCLKDDTMAESINLFLAEHKNTKVLHVQGAFHGDEHLGVVEKLNKLNPALRTLVITPVEAGDYEDVKNKYGKDTILLTFVRQ